MNKSLPAQFKSAFTILKLLNRLLTNQSTLILNSKLLIEQKLTCTEHSFPDFSSDESEAFVFCSTLFERNVRNGHAAQLPAELAPLLQRAPPADVELELKLFFLKFFLVCPIMQLLFLVFFFAYIPSSIQS